MSLLLQIIPLIASLLVATAVGGDKPIYDEGLDRFFRGLDPDNDPRARYKKFQNKYRYRPYAFVRDCFKWDESKNEGPTDYQGEILKNLIEKRRISIRGARGLGKSALLSWIILWFALTRDGEDWKIIVTASQWNQLRDYLWPEVHKWARKLDWDEIGREPFTNDELLKQRIQLETGIAASSSPEKSGGIEGAHAENVLFIFDESKNVRDEVFDSAEGTFSGAGTDTEREAYACAFSTPGEPVGRFSDIHHKKAGLENWWTRHVTLEETIKAKRVSREWAEAMAKLWGENSPLYKNHVLGEFAVTAHNAVIPLAWVEAAEARWRDLYLPADDGYVKGHPGALTRIGVDVGGEIDDTVYALRFGRALWKVIVQKQPDQEIISKEVMEIMTEYNPNATAVVDSIGVGSAVHKILRKRVNSIPFGAGEGTDLLDSSGEFGFKNKRAALWWNMRELLDPNSGEDIALVPDDRLKGELIIPTYREVAGGKIQVQEKDQIKKENDGRSTDVADASLQAFWRGGRERQRQNKPKARTYSKKRRGGAKVYRRRGR